MGAQVQQGMAAAVFVDFWSRSALAAGTWRFLTGPFGLSPFSSPGSNCSKVQLCFRRFFCFTPELPSFIA